MPRKRVTHCPQGHEYNEANTRYYKNQRHCRICDKLRKRRINGSRPYVPKAACPQGHEYDEANTRHYQGHRHCRACDRQRKRRLRDSQAVDKPKPKPRKLIQL